MRNNLSNLLFCADLQSASASSTNEPKEISSKHAQTEETGEGNPISADHLQRLRKDSKAADVSSGKVFFVFFLIHVVIP